MTVTTGSQKNQNVCLIALFISIPHYRTAAAEQKGLCELL